MTSMTHVNLPAPVLASRASPAMGDRYGFVPTSAVLTALQHQGFQVAQTDVRRVRKPERAPYAKHMLRLRHADAGPSNGGVPEVIIINSHDGSTALSIMAGWFRFVCGNGLIVGDGIQTIKVYHRDRARLIDNVIEGAFEIIGYAGQVRETAEVWSTVHLDPQQRFQLAGRAIDIRWPSTADAEETDDLSRPTPWSILRPRRTEDTQHDLWTTLNVVQENLFAPNESMTVQSATGRWRRPRAIRSIGPSVSWNRALWQMASEFTEAA